jgi:hypothetical protein
VSLAARTPEFLKKGAIRVLEGRATEDVYPTVYAINTPQKVEEYGTSTGFDVETCELVPTSAFTAVLGPLSVFELLYIRLTALAPLASLRPDMIAVLRHPSGARVLATPERAEQPFVRV